MGPRRPWIRGIAAVAVLGALTAAVITSPAGAAIRIIQVRRIATAIANSVVDSKAIPNTVVYRRSDKVTVGPGAEGFAAIGCPGGYLAVGGGHVGNRFDNWTSSSYPGVGTNLLQAGHTGWQVFLNNDSAFTISFRAYVICLKASTLDSNYPAGVHPLT